MTAPSSGTESTRFDRIVALMPWINRLLTLILIGGVVFLFYEPLLFALRNNATKVSALGVTLELSPQGPLKKIFEVKSPSANFLTIFKSLSARLERTGGCFVGEKILWIDDNHPTQNIQERDVLREMGLFVEYARTTDEVQNLLDKTACLGLQPYRVIISNNSWGDDLTAGQRFLGELFDSHKEAKLILYTSSFDPNSSTPNYLFGITNRYDELFHLILDALER
ncbi:MAG: hypothetical protein ACK5UC_22415 [Planctomycetaceae bacterium]|jgi:hypothetical protein